MIQNTSAENRVINILHLEDAPDVQALVKSVLGMVKAPEGFEIKFTQVKSVDEANQLMSERNYDLYLSDHSVEGGKGTDVLEVLTDRVNSGQSIPPREILYISAEITTNTENDPFYKEGALNQKVRGVLDKADMSGNVDFFVKPLPLAELKGKLSSLVGQIAQDGILPSETPVKKATAAAEVEEETGRVALAPLSMPPISAPDSFVARLDAEKQETVKSKVLIVEGNEMVQNMLVKHFERRGHEVLTAEFIADAFDVLDQNSGKVDAIVADNYTYDTENTGVTFLDDLASDPAHNHIPVYLFVDPEEIIGAEEIISAVEARSDNAPDTKVYDRSKGGNSLATAADRDISDAMTLHA